MEGYCFELRVLNIFYIEEQESANYNQFTFKTFPLFLFLAESFPLHLQKMFY